MCIHKLTLALTSNLSFLHCILIIKVTLPAPVQCHALALDLKTQKEIDKILIEYQHHSLHLRCGSSLPEHTLPHSPYHKDVNIELDSERDKQSQLNIISTPVQFTEDKENMLFSTLSNRVCNMYIHINI